MVIDTSKHKGYHFIGDVICEIFGRGNYKKLISSKFYAMKMKSFQKKPFFITGNCRRQCDKFFNLRRKLKHLIKAIGEWEPKPLEAGKVYNRIIIYFNS